MWNKCSERLRELIRPLPDNEAARLEALRRYDILDRSPEAALDDFTRLAAHLCGVPTAVISLVAEDRQWFESKVGMSTCRTSRDVWFYAHALLQPEISSSRTPPPTHASPTAPWLRVIPMSAFTPAPRWSPPTATPSAPSASLTRCRAR